MCRFVTCFMTSNEDMKIVGGPYSHGTADMTSEPICL